MICCLVFSISSDCIESHFVSDTVFEIQYLRKDENYIYENTKIIQNFKTFVGNSFLPQFVINLIKRKVNSYTRKTDNRAHSGISCPEVIFFFTFPCLYDYS